MRSEDASLVAGASPLKFMSEIPRYPKIGHPSHNTFGNKLTFSKSNIRRTGEAIARSSSIQMLRSWMRLL